MRLLADKEVHPGDGDRLSDHCALLSTVRLAHGPVAS